jgi:hypothetical protein
VNIPPRRVIHYARPMDSRLRRLQARILPHGFLDAARQVALFGAVYLGYRIVRGLVEGRATAAFRHAYDLIHIEQGLHLFVEPSIQAWASGSRLLMHLSSWMYVNAQTSVTVGALVYLYLCRNRSFYFVRNMFMIAMGIALVAYAFFPTAPPRFMPEWGFFDPVANDTGMRLATAHGGGGVTAALANIYAAVPSMHVAFALMIGWPLARLVRPRPLKVLWAAYPLLMTFVIIATANHFILEAVLGALTAAVSAFGARRLGRARPGSWRFSPPRLEAEVPA